MKVFSLESAARFVLAAACAVALVRPARVAHAQEAKPSGRPQLVLQSGSHSIYCVAWSSDGATLATGTHFGSIRLWDARSGTLLRALEEPGKHVASRTINTIALSPDGKLLASGDTFSEIKIWNVATGQVVRYLEKDKGGPESITRPAHAGEILSVAWSPDGKTVASASLDKTAALWDAATGARLFTLKGHKQAVATVAFSPDGTTLASVSDDVKLWDARTGAPKGVLPLSPKDEAPTSLDACWSRDGTMLAVASHPLKVWDMRTQTPRNEGKVSDLPFPGDLWAVEFSPDGKLMATSHGPESDDARQCDVLLWDTRTWELKQTLRGHKKAVTDLAFSPNAKSLVSVSLDGKLKVWSLLDKRPPVTLVPMEGRREDWIAMTEEGFYDAPDSEAMTREATWRVGDDEVPLATFAPTFHRPDIVRRLLQPEPIAANSAIGLLLAARSAPPALAFLSPTPNEKVKGETVSVQVMVSDELADQKLEFRVNGRPVPVAFSVGPPQDITDTNRSQVLGGKAAPASHVIARRYNATIPLPPGESKILVRALARDPSGLEGVADIFVERQLTNARGAALATLRGDEAREAEKLFQGDLHVLTVGVSRYKNPNYSLNYPVADATAFAALWPPMKDRLYRNVLTTQLADDKATSPALQAELDKLIQKTTNKDTVLIFLAGHGIQVDNQDFYFGTHEVDFKNPQQTALPWTSLTNILAKVPAKRVVLFLDACHSGSALGEARASNEQMAETLVKRAGVMVFASSRGDQVSLESAEWKHGAFTKAVLEGIAEGKANLDTGEGQDGNITVAKLLVFLQARVPKLTGGQQNPACPLMQDFGEPFRLARLPGAQ